MQIEADGTRLDNYTSLILRKKEGQREMDLE
jgi:hypothetical protein